MTLLAPIAGLIAAALVVPALLLFYMLKLRRRPVRVSSTLLWEQAARDLQANVPLRWLRPSWLLLLQLLGVVALLLAVARPAIEGGAPAAGRMILVIDASASMAAPGLGAAPDATRLDEARERALALVRDSARSADAVEIGVIAMAGEARMLATPTSDLGAVRLAIESVQQTDQPADFGAALRLVVAQQARGESDEAPAPTRVVLLSDGAIPPAPADVPGVRESDFQFVRVGPPPDAPRSNLGLTTVSAVRDFDRPALVRVFARIVNAASEPVSAPVTIRLDGRPVRAASVEVSGATPQGVGEGALSAEFEAVAGGALTLTIERADELEPDNIAALRLPRAGAARVLVVSDGAPDPFLARALGAAIGRDAESATIGEYEERARNPRWPASFDLIVFHHATAAGPPPVATLSFAAPAPAGRIALRALAEPGLTRRFASWRRSHPLLRHVALDQVVLAPESVLDIPEAADATVLATIDAGPVMAIVEDGPMRRAAVSFAPEDSNWPVQVSFAVFVANAVSHLAPGALGAEAVGQTTGEPMVVRVAPGARRVEAKGPALLSAPVPEGASSVTLGIPPRAGLYLVDGAVEDDRIVGVNVLSDLESSIATRDSVRVPGGADEAAASGVAGDREIWHWFVLAGFVLLTLEWLLYAWRMRV